jgi:hypothetical protein
MIGPRCRHPPASYSPAGRWPRRAACRSGGGTAAAAGARPRGRSAPAQSQFVTRKWSACKAVTVQLGCQAAGRPAGGAWSPWERLSSARAHLAGGLEVVVAQAGCCEWWQAGLQGPWAQQMGCCTGLPNQVTARRGINASWTGTQVGAGMDPGQHGGHQAAGPSIHCMHARTGVTLVGLAGCSWWTNRVVALVYAASCIRLVCVGFPHECTQPV